MAYAELDYFEHVMFLVAYGASLALFELAWLTFKGDWTSAYFAGLCLWRSYLDKFYFVI